jgi:putative oxidoreductase
MRNDDLGKLLLRIAVGALMLFHGVGKLRHGVGWLTDELVAHHLPGFIAYGVFVGEVLGPILVLAGFFTRLAALAIAMDMVVAVYLEHTSQLVRLGPSGGYALELQAFYFLGALAIFFLGAGRYAVKRGAGRFS